MPVATYENLSSFQDDSISGNKVHGGVISAFSSQGIEDLATQTTLRISNDRVSVDRLRIKELEGQITVHGSLKTTGSLSAKEDATFEQNVSVLGELTVSKLTVLTANNGLTSSTNGAFVGATNDELDGKGLTWAGPDFTHQLVFKSEPKKLWSSETIDLHRSAKYQIDGVNVLESNRLGDGVIFSNLKNVGVLESLKVRGSAEIAETVFVNSSLGRFGINTDQPNAALSVVDDLMEIVIGSYNGEEAYIGTWSPTTLHIGTDNTARITIDGSTISFGSEKNKNAVVKVHGTLEVSQLITDTRIERTSPIEFQATAENSIYGKGLTWKGAGVSRQFFMMPNPDRLHSTESISLSEGKEFRIGGNTVLTKTSLGEVVTESNLTKLGVLSSLTVAGTVDLNNKLQINETNLLVQKDLHIVNDNITLTYNSKGVDTNGGTFGIYNRDSIEFSVDTQGNLQLGNKENTNRVVNVYGKIAVNVTNPPDDAAFTVDGDIVINGRRQVHSSRLPETGRWNKGDIVWNSEPHETSYIGWVCTVSGTPGTWKPFGYISER